MVAINSSGTVIFMDTKTTGLMRYGKNFDQNSENMMVPFPRNLYLNKTGVPRITGMVLIAKPASSLNNDKFQYSRSFDNVLYDFIRPDLSDNEQIEHYEQIEPIGQDSFERVFWSSHPTFGEKWPSILKFMNSFEGPITIVAYNGMRFDFHILLNEFKQAGLDLNNCLPKDCKFVDAMQVFPMIDNKYEPGNKWETLTDNQSINERKIPYAIKGRLEKLMHAGSYDWFTASYKRLQDLFEKVFPEETMNPMDCKARAKALVNICLAYEEEFVDSIDMHANDVFVGFK